MIESSSFMAESSRSSSSAQSALHWIQVSLILDLAWLTGVQLVVDAEMQSSAIWIIATLLIVSMSFESLQKKIFQFRQQHKSDRLGKFWIYMLGAIAILALIEIGVYLLPFLDGKTAIAAIFVGAAASFKIYKLFGLIRRSASASNTVNSSALSGLEPEIMARLAALACILLPIGGMRLALWGCAALLTAKR